MPNKQKLVQVALIQWPPVFLNLAASLEKALALMEQAAQQGAVLVVFPESWLPGYPVWLDYAPKAALWDYKPAKVLYRILSENSMAIPGPEFEQLRQKAQKLQIDLVMGIHERLGHTLYNTMLFISKKNQAFQIHRKIMPTYTERLVWGQGDGSTLQTLASAYGPIGGLICWEHWMPLARAVMHAKQECIHIAQWPAVKELHQIASRHYAFEGQCFVLASGSYLTRKDMLDGFHSLGSNSPEPLELLEAFAGPDDAVILGGGSAIIAPDSTYVMAPLLEKPGIVYGTLDLDLIREGNLALDTAGHYARPDLFQLEVNVKPLLNVQFKS
ncbi:MAG: carbon-nitrogen hydrolase family protein [Desulfobacteraceae bacterium]|nr:MAG: carbon-nitrogen hydrolase family protein [Desulfobacteraceae bacterium]